MEPVVYHGYTLTTKILFRDVITTVEQHAFVVNSMLHDIHVLDWYPRHRDQCSLLPLEGPLESPLSCICSHE